MEDLPKVDLNKVNTFVNERDLKLCEQQTRIKYTKRAYHEFQKENENLNKDIVHIEKKIKKIEEESLKYEVLTDQIKNSLTIASNAIGHLIQRRIDAENNVIISREKYENLIEQFAEIFESKKKSLANNNPLYKELGDITLKVQKLDIEYKILEQRIIDRNKMVMMKEEINNKIINTHIVAFVQIVYNSQKLQKVNQEIVAKKIVMKNLLELYENQMKNKGKVEFQRPMKTTELPKCSIQFMSSSNAIKVPGINLPMITIPNDVTPPKINESVLMKQLQQRSSERKKIILSQQTSMLRLPFKNPKNQSIETKTFLKKRALEANENIKSLSSDKENYEPPLKINVIQNVSLNNSILKGNTLLERNEQSCSEKNKAKEKKRIKKVSFGETLIPTTNSSSFMENIPTIKDKQLETTSPFFENRFAGDTCSNFTREDLMESKDMSVVGFNTFSPLHESQNESLHDENNNDTLFAWSQATSTQQSTDIGNMFRIF